jgi:hypothetical protein
MTACFSTPPRLGCDQLDDAMMGAIIGQTGKKRLVLSARMGSRAWLTACPVLRRRSVWQTLRQVPLTRRRAPGPHDHLLKR